MPPELRKDFLVDPWQVAESRALGADCILIILAMVDDALAADLLAEAERFGMDALIETHDEWQVSDRRYLSEASMAQIGATATEPGKEVAVPELMAS